MLEPFIADWLNFLIRWGHMVAGIAWIGTSFYFVALDFSLKSREGLAEGVRGEAWEVHGGGFYHVQKYLSAPKSLPEHLTWFKWEAYLTWVTGFLLLMLRYRRQILGLPPVELDDTFTRSRLDVGADFEEDLMDASDADRDGTPDGHEKGA